MPKAKIGLSKIKQIISEEIELMRESESAEVDAKMEIKVLKLIEPFESAIKKFEDAEKTAALTAAFTPILQQLKDTVKNIRKNADTYALDRPMKQPFKRVFKAVESEEDE